jgi:hypothetical protein
MLIKSKISFLLFSLFISTIFSGKVFSQKVSHLDSLDGKFALQFQINENFRLSNFQGTVLSGKYHFSRRDAIRIGVSLYLRGSDAEYEINYFDTTAVDNSKLDDNKFEIIVNTQYIRYLNVSESIAFFGGVGPFFSYTDGTNERVISVGGIEKKSESQINGYGIGLDLIAGVEWWFHKQMSLSAEYGIQFAYRSSENIIRDEEKEGKTEYTTYDLTGNQINFGVSVYF